MKICIKEQGAKRGFKILLPTSLIIFIARIIFSLGIYKLNKDKKIEQKFLQEGNICYEKNNWNITSNDIKQIINTLKHMNKYYKGLTLVDIESDDGDIVKIII